MQRSRSALLYLILERTQVLWSSVDENAASSVGFGLLSRVPSVRARFCVGWCIVVVVSARFSSPLKLSVPDHGSNILRFLFITSLTPVFQTLRALVEADSAGWSHSLASYSSVPLCLRLRRAISHFLNHRNTNRTSSSAHIPTHSIPPARQTASTLPRFRLHRLLHHR